MFQGPDPIPAKPQPTSAAPAAFPSRWPHPLTAALLVAALVALVFLAVREPASAGLCAVQGVVAVALALAPSLVQRSTPAGSPETK